ncbi:MAG: PilZ domain-containing protein [Gammaproteobacteria bacterium]
MVTSPNNRKHPRLNHRAEVQVTGADGRSERLHMRNFSHSGMFIQCHREKLPEVGDLLEVRTLEIDDAPVLTVRVVRVSEGQGFAVEFI